MSLMVDNAPILLRDIYMHQKYSVREDTYMRCNGFRQVEVATLKVYIELDASQPYTANSTERMAVFKIKSWHCINPEKEAPAPKTRTVEPGSNYWKEFEHARSFNRYSRRINLILMRFR